MVLQNIFRAGSGGVFLSFVCIMCSVGTLSAQNRRGETPRYDARTTASNHAAYQSQTLTPVLTGRPASTIFRIQNPPAFAVKTNLVYAATTTPNFGVEFGLGQKTTLELSGGFNPWGKEPVADENGILSDEKKLKHWLGRSELKYWLSSRFNGHYLGIQALYTDFDIHGYDIPLLLDKEFYNDGTAFGGGVSYGYHWVLSKRWGVEFNAGVGVLQVDYNEKTCDTCDDEATRIKKTYFGPIGAGIKFVFIIK